MSLGNAAADVFFKWQVQGGSGRPTPPFFSRTYFVDFGERKRPPNSVRCANIAAARAVDREFIYNFGSNLCLLGSGRGVNGRAAPVGLIWAEFQLKRSHGDPFHAQSSRLCATGSNSGASGS